MKSYVDLYLLPVPRKKITAYRREATTFGKIARKCGALNYREFIGDDLSHQGTLSFSRAVQLGRSEILTAAVAEFRSRSHRNYVMRRVLDHPRIKEMMKTGPLGNMKKMHYGGFKNFVNT